MNDAWGYSALEAHLGHSFTRRELLVEALTPGAFAQNHPEGSGPHNGRLAFLGDAVIYLLATEHVLGESPPPQSAGRVRQGKLTERRKLIVANGSLARRAAIQLPLRQRAGQAEDAGRGDRRRSASAIEAIVGAVYEDTGRDLKRTAEVARRLLPGAFDAAASLKS